MESESGATSRSTTARLRGVRWLRVVLLLVASVTVVLAVAVVVTLRMDLGPSLARLVEQQASARISRPVHIGALSLQLGRGRVEARDILIEGRVPTDRPFLRAARVSVALDWSQLVQRRPRLIVTDIEADDWQMLVERFADGDSFIRFRSPGGPSRFDTDVRAIRGTHGQFAFEDHTAPWSILAPNLDIAVTNREGFTGAASFRTGRIAIDTYVPFAADFTSHFSITGPKLHFDRIVLDSDGAQTIATADIDMSRWPEQFYYVNSHLQLQRMRELFFAAEPWQMAGAGDFDGTVRIFRDGYDVAGNFTAPDAGVYAYRFPNAYGSLHWTPRHFGVYAGGAEFSGGQATFSYNYGPRGVPGETPTHRFDASYANVEATQLSAFYQLTGTRFAGRLDGHNYLEWPNGRFAEHRGEGHVVLTPPAGVTLMGESLDAARAADPDHTAREWGPFAPMPLPTAVAASLRAEYRYDEARVAVSRGTFATEHSRLAFDGQTAWGGASSFTVAATSGDLQETDQVLAGILTDLGAPTAVIPLGGWGTFSGTLTGPLAKPRIEGDVMAEDVRAWDTLWGVGTAHVTVENGYAQVRDGHMRTGDSDMRAEGRFSLGYPRADHGEEIDARIWAERRDIDSLRHAFELDDYPVTGLLSGEVHLTGGYESPVGFGTMSVADLVAYDEVFQSGDASLRFDGAGVHVDGITAHKWEGRVTGSAQLQWAGTYAFEATGTGIPAEHITLLEYPYMQPSGPVQFTAAGSGTFDVPSYDARFTLPNLWVAQEPVGVVTGTAHLRGKEVSGDMEASSGQLSLTATATMGLTYGYPADMRFRLHDTPLDPYARVLWPTLEPSNTAVASGSLHVTGLLDFPETFAMQAQVDRLDLSIYDYPVHLARPLLVSMDRQVVHLDACEFVGDQTRLSVAGSVSLADERVAVRVAGDANLGIVQAFAADVRASGRATLTAAVDGPMREPLLSGTAVIADGRFRHFSFPNALDGVNGTIRFDQRGLRVDDVTATIGGGRVQFGGRIDLDGYAPGALSLTARGDGMRFRYPEGVRSTVDADLAVRGTAAAPLVAGTVRVQSASLTRRIDPGSGLFDFGGRSETPAAAAAPSATPIALDVQVLVPSTLRVENNLARLVASADLQLRGTVARPVLAGRAEVDKGEITFEGRRYVMTRGTIDFTNPTRIEPFFDLEAQTRVRVPGQTYQVLVRAVGTAERLQPELSSNPPLPTGDVIALLFGDARRTQGAGDAEVRALQNPNELQRDLLTTRATQLLATPLSSQVGRVVEQTFGVDTFQVSPSIFDPYAQSTSRVNPSARVTIGKRVSERAYLTFSRSLNSSLNDQILLLEYDASDRLSWVLSRNEDATYAVEMRRRHVF